MYEVPVTQKSLSNKQVTVGHMTNVFYQIHYKIFCPNVTFIIAWFPNEMSGFHSTKRCFLEKKKSQQMKQVKKKIIIYEMETLVLF